MHTSLKIIRIKNCVQTDLDLIFQGNCLKDRLLAPHELLDYNPGKIL